MKTDFVKKLATGLLLMLSLLISYTAMGAFNSTITVKVVDAETDEPIEGAVVLVQWTKTTGIGYKATSHYKVLEEVSDRHGKITIPGLFKFGVDAPWLVVYKKGYTAWRHNYIFPSYDKRTNFRWKEGYVFKLKKFQPKHSFKQHVSFISSAYTEAPPESEFEKAYRWEELRAAKGE